MSFAIPDDVNGVPYIANLDASNNPAVPSEIEVTEPGNVHVAEAATRRQQQILTTAPLTGNATYTSPAIDSLAVPQDNMVCAHVYADQPGTLYMDVSMDNTNWNLTQASVAVSAGVAATIPWQAPLDRYYRFRYVNGANAQGTFRLSTSAMSVAGPQNVNASITGSLANDGLTPGAGDVAQFNQDFNGATWDKQRGNTELTLLASAARTSSTVSPTQTNYNAKGIIVWINVTAASGTGGLQVIVQGGHPLIGGYAPWLTAAPAAITSTGVRGYAFYPGISTVAGTGINVAINGILPRTFSVLVQHGDSSSYTYALGASLIL
ncbi:hypothetical protein [Desulfosporosinus sp. SB140]|uniref:hypothetical protein n=1 Tax=Desulfosporosinus paludis TaxID=3115649 RepID=UPI003890889B